MKTSICLVVALFLIAVIAAAPAEAQQPSPRSYMMWDSAGGFMECFDFKSSGTLRAYFNGRTGNYLSMSADEIFGTTQDSIFWGAIGKWIPMSYGLYVRRSQFHGTCEGQGQVFWGFGVFDGTASCAASMYHRIPGFGNFNDTVTLNQIGRGEGRTCNGLIGGSSNQSESVNRQRIID